jgi:hypothetical protein
VYLLGSRRVGARVQGVLVWLSGVATGLVLFAPTRQGVAGPDLPTGKLVFGIGPRVFAAVGSGVAALVIIVGALWSAIRLLRGRTPALAGAERVVFSPRRLVLANLLIATGTLVLSASGTLAGRLGEEDAFSVTLLVGVAVLFGGFLVASAPQRPRPASDQ